MTNQTEPTQRARFCINHAALKRHILQTAKAVRPHWRCNRVAGEALEHYEAFIANMVTTTALDLAPRADLPAFDNDRLLIWSTVRRRLLEHWRAKLKWLTITKVDDLILRHMEDRLRAKVRNELSSHPTLGRTFRP